MADPISIIGVISASLHLVEKVTTQIVHFKQAPGEADDLRKEITSVGVVLEILKSRIEQDSGSFPHTTALFVYVQGCQRQLKSIGDSLELPASSRRIEHIWGRIKWASDRKNVLEAVDSLHRYAHIFHFALTSDGL